MKNKLSVDCTKTQGKNASERNNWSWDVPPELQRCVSEAGDQAVSWQAGRFMGLFAEREKLLTEQRDQNGLRVKEPIPL